MAAKICSICSIRPAMNTKQLRDLGLGRDFADQCRACHVEAEHENTHSDYGHDIDGPDLPNDDDASGGRVKGCWICHPEINEALATYKARTGTSRQGMRLTVPVRAAGKAKAEAVKAQLPEGYTVTIRQEKGRTTLRAKGPVTLVLHWDAHRGGFAAGTAQATNGTAKRVRNASEALRAAGV